MTCIVGVEHEGEVTIGGDAAAIEDSAISVRLDAKVFTLGEYVIGFADSYRAGQRLRYGLHVPTQICQDDFEHMATVFVDSLAKALDGVAGLGGDESPVFLVGYRGALYYIDCDLHVGRTICGYEAIGLGGPIALGSMASTTGSPYGRILTALAAAERHSTAVCAPFTILSTPSSEWKMP
jgi:hypothetical protein